jgi:hypothetical protein
VIGRDWRDVPVEWVRAWARDESERTSLRDLAERADIGRTTLQKFITGATNPHPRIRRALTLLYLKDKASAVDSALDALTANLPDEARPEARAQISGLVARLHEAHEVKPPPLPGGSPGSGL